MENFFEFTKSRVLVPAGKCPAILKSESREDVAEWIKEIQRFKKPNEIFEVSVYRYWAHRIYSDDRELLNKVLDNIATVTNSKETLYSLMKDSLEKDLC